MLEDTVALFVVREQGFPSWFSFDLLWLTVPWLCVIARIRDEIYRRGVIEVRVPASLSLTNFCFSFA